MVEKWFLYHQFSKKKMMKYFHNPYTYSTIFIIVILAVHRIPFWYLLETFNVSSQISGYTVKTLQSLIVVVLALTEIKRLHLWKHAGLRISRIDNFYLYLFLVPYLFIFTGGFSFIGIFEKVPLQVILLPIILKVISIGLMEEIVFRGLLQGKFIDFYKSRRNIFLGVFIPALIFGISHFINVRFENNTIYNVSFQVYAAFCLGSLFGALLVRTKNIFPLIIVHAIINFNSEIDQLYGVKEAVKTSATLGQTFFSIIFSFILFGSALFIAYMLLVSISKNNITPKLPFW